MADKPKTKEEFIKFFDKEIEKMDEKITETLKRASWPFGFGGWNYEKAEYEGETYDDYYVSVKLITPNIPVSHTFSVNDEVVRESAKEMGIPEEWLNDREFYKKFKKYLIYESISNFYLPKGEVIRLASYLDICLEEAKKKLEEVI
jgi:hypothetical protein